jgi:hypothetical protein
MVQNSHDTILIPPLRILDTLDLTSHHDNLTSRNKFATAISGPEVGWNTRNSDITSKGLG